MLWRAVFALAPVLIERARAREAMLLGGLWSSSAASGKGVEDVEDMERFWVVVLRDRWARACSRDINWNVGDWLRSIQPGGRPGPICGDEILLVDKGAFMGSGADISFPWNVEALFRGLLTTDEVDVSGVKVTDLDVRDSVTVAVESLRATLKAERGAGVRSWSSA
jgi:hypothetical protein